MTKSGAKTRRKNKGVSPKILLSLYTTCPFPHTFKNIFTVFINMSVLAKFKTCLLVLIIACCASCDDSTDFIGSSVVEGPDHIEAYRATFYPSSVTIKADTIFTRSSTAYIGKYTHPDFGSFESSFMAQFNVTEAYEIPSLGSFVPTGGRREFDLVENVNDRSFTPKRFYIGGLYTSYFGDSSAVGRINVYQLNQDLYNDDDIYYSDIEPADFYDSEDLLGSSFYSPINLSIPEEDRENNYLYITVDLPVEKGEEIMDLYNRCKKNNQSFRNAFLKEFKGIYAQQIQGDGAMLYLDQVRLYFLFDRYELDEDGKPMEAVNHTDSVVETSFSFSTTKEVVQVNKFRNNTPESIIQEDTCTYLKSPAGLFTQVRIPLKAISDSIMAKGDSLNAVSVTFFTDSLREDESGILGPDYLLLIRDTATIGGVFHNYQKAFFADNQLPDSRTTYLATAGPKGYSFNDIRYLISDAIEEYKAVGEIPEYLNVLLIPVSTTTDGSSTVGVNHNLTPAYARLLGGKDASRKRIKLNVYYCRYR